MKLNLVRTALFISVLGLMALPASADEWTKNYTVTGRPDLRVETSDANIRVTTGDQSTIQAKVITSRYKIGEGGIHIEERQNGNSVEIEVRYPHHNLNFEWGPGHRVDIIIQMPREGRVNLRTGDGKIEVGDLKGEMDLHTGDGSVNLNGRFDELELKTGDGHVEVRAASGSSLASSWRLETGDGGVSLEVPQDLAANVDLHTNDGHIDLDMRVTTEGAMRQNEIRGKLNGGGNLLTIRTGDGSIHLKKG